MNTAFRFPLQSLGTIEWALPPTELPLSADDVHIWRAWETPSDEQLQALAATLSEDEQARAAKFRFSRDREQFILARGTLRLLLAQYWDVAPAHLRFAYEPNGKPYLTTTNGARTPLQFNVSHTSGLVVLAFAWQCEVGIDVERVRPEFADDLTAQQFLTTAELNAWRALSPALQPQAFFHRWTCKEAYLKAIGAGLSVAPTTLSVTLNDDATPREIELSAAPAAPWSFSHFAPQPDYLGALAVSRPPSLCRFWMVP